MLPDPRAVPVILVQLVMLVVELVVVPHYKHLTEEDLSSESLAELLETFEAQQ